MPSDSDGYRFLDLNPARPPTSRLDRAARGEPELVGRHYEELLAQRARRVWLERQRHEWAAVEDVIVPAIASFEAVADPRLRRDLRALVHVTRTVAARVAALS
jgi:hypothetical protein